MCAGRCFDQHTGVAFFPFTEALALPVEDAALLPDAAALQQWPELARLLPDAAAEPHAADQDQTQLHVFRAVTAFLRATAAVNPLECCFSTTCTGPIRQAWPSCFIWGGI